MLEYLMECEGETRAAAEEKALEVLQLSANDVEFENVSSGGGLKRLFKNSPVLLRVFPKGKEVASSSIIRGIAYTLLYKLGGEAEIVDVAEKEGNVHLSLESPKSALLIGKHGRTLDALQFLLNLLVSRWDHKSKRIILDVSDYRERRRQSIEALCEMVAGKVAKRGKPITLNYMSPYERRIVHLLLDNDDRVYTESVGDGTYKRVGVYPQKGSNKGYDNRKDYTDRPNVDENFPDTVSDGNDDYAESSSEDYAAIQKKHADKVSREEHKEIPQDDEQPNRSVGDH